MSEEADGVLIFRKPMTLTWQHPDGSTFSTLDPDDRAARPHERMDVWDRTVLAAALRKILSELDAAGLPPVDGHREKT
jgi:hypothetical protein